jgi:hypothetical protein
VTKRPEVIANPQELGLIRKWKKQGAAMTSANDGRLEMPFQTVNRLREGWLHDRKERLAAQLAANIDVRRRWMECDTSGQEKTISQGD